jgi:hypothetical protein
MLIKTRNAPNLNAVIVTETKRGVSYPFTMWEASSPEAALKVYQMEAERLGYANEFNTLNDACNWSEDKDASLIRVLDYNNLDEMIDWSNNGGDRIRDYLVSLGWAYEKVSPAQYNACANLIAEAIDLITRADGQAIDDELFVMLHTARSHTLREKAHMEDLIDSTINMPVEF